MKSRFHCNFALAVVLFGMAPACLLGQLPTPSRKGTWPMACLEKPASYEVFLPVEGSAGVDADGKRGGIVYLKNLASERAGTEPDGPILADLLREGFVVLVLDLQGQPKAVAPYINADLRLLRRGMGRLFSAEAVNHDHVYLLAEGDRLKLNIVYYEKNGETFRLDLRYPSRPRQPSPVLMQIPVSNSNRLDNKDGHYRYNDLIAECGLTLGYAVALVDPPLKTYAGIDTMPDVAWRLKAAVRTIRSEAESCSLAEKICVMGFSRSSGQAAILAFSGGLKNLEGKGPHQQFSSNVQAAVLHAGRMDHELIASSGHSLAKGYTQAWGPPVSDTELVMADTKEKKVELLARRARWRDPSAVTYVTAGDPPAFLCTGDKDDFRPAQMARLAAALKQAGVPHEHVVVPDMAHSVVADVEVLKRIYAFLEKELRAK